MSDPTHVCVAVILEKKHYPDWHDSHETFIDYMEEKYSDYTWQNDERTEDMPEHISFGYESSTSWGKGQDYVFQDGYDNTIGEVFIIGYELASTWNGVIVFNEELLDEISHRRHKLEELFPDIKPQVIVRGFQI